MGQIAFQGILKLSETTQQMHRTVAFTLLASFIHKKVFLENMDSVAAKLLQSIDSVLLVGGGVWDYGDIFGFGQNCRTLPDHCGLGKHF